MTLSAQRQIRVLWWLANLTDIQLPSWMAMRRIKANPEMKEVPVIAVISYAMSGDEAKALAVGCNAYVTKPYSPRALLAKIREYLA
jgi:two-component system cell cycle response regulator DivK